MCYENLRPDAQSILWLISFLHHDIITEELFQQAAINMQEQGFCDVIPPSDTERVAREHVIKLLDTFLDSGGRWDTTLFSEAISEISSRSLIEYDQVNQAYNIHVLVQDWVRTIIPHPEDLALECATTLLSLSIDYKDTINSRRFRRLIGAHVDRILLRQAGTLSANHAGRFARVYAEKRQWLDAEKQQLLVQAAAVQNLGKEHPETLESTHYLARIKFSQGRWHETEELQTQVFETRKRVLGAEHKDTLASSHNLALAYQNQGRWEEAVLLQTEVLHVQQRTLGEKDPHTLRTMHNLALTYQKEGRWDEAERLQTQVRNVRTEVLGPEHLDTLTSMHNLAVTYQNQSRWSDAAKLHAQILDGREKALGEEHPDTQESMAALSVTCQSLGRHSNSNIGPELHSPTPEGRWFRFRRDGSGMGCFGEDWFFQNWFNEGWYRGVSCSGGWFSGDWCQCVNSCCKGFCSGYSGGGGGSAGGSGGGVNGRNAAALYIGGYGSDGTGLGCTGGGTCELAQAIVRVYTRPAYAHG